MQTGIITPVKTNTAIQTCVMQLVMTVIGPEWLKDINIQTLATPLVTTVAKKEFQVITFMMTLATQIVTCAVI